MFGNSRRYRPPNPPLYSASANPNATSAAASAFMSASNQKSDRTLSSAAAAAALRARPHTPTNVGQVQTKRTIRRSASVSSAGSAPAVATSRPTVQLERKGSSGSMTDRTFRSPSPRRSTSNQATEERPPVPQIPSGHKKSASAGVGMQPFRTASQKVKTGHTSWYTQPSGDPRNVRTSDAPMRTGKPQQPQLQSVAAPQRPDSRSSSMNFSYPIGFRTQSPPASPTSTHAPRFSSPPPRRPASPPRSNRASFSSVTSGKSDRPMVYDPNSRRMVPKATVDNVEYYVKEAAGKQTKRKEDGIRREGSHLAKGTVARVRGTAVDANEGERNFPKREQPVMEAAPTGEESQILDEPAVKAIITAPGKPSQQQDESKRNQSPQLQDLQKSRLPSPPPPQHITHNPNANSPASLILGKKPSIVHEESDETDDEVDSIARPSQKVLDALDAVPTRLSITEQDNYLQPSSPELANEAAKKRSMDNTSPELAGSPKATTEKRAAFMENKLVTELSRESSNSRRSSSNSPARQAHFSTTPSDNLAVRYAPLPRSASPIKSALKRTSPTPREVSPSDKSSELSGSRHISPHQGEENTTSRKKSVRVSFDDRTMATVVGESATTSEGDSPAPPSPQQAKRHWYSNIGRSKRRDYALEDDEIMTPRPALPSFGSVREQKSREPEERPLVRPHDPNYSPAIPSSPELRPSGSDATGDAGTPKELSPGPGQSSDRAIGSVLVQEQTSRNAPNISRFREPLPPVVTSVEGSGYISDSNRSSDSDDDLLDSVAGASDTEEIPSTQPTQLEIQDSSQNNSVILEGEKPANTQVEIPNQTRLSQDIPEIAITQPSPHVPEPGGSGANMLENDYFEVPGGFPEEDLDSTSNSNPRPTPKTSEDQVTGNSSPSAIFEPKALVHSVQPETLPQTILATTTPVGVEDDHSTDDSEASIYSDAYEDPSEMEGFMSLDAVVESPISKARPQLSELPGDVPEQVDMKEIHSQVNQQLPVAPRPPEPPQDADNWEQAKAFWRSLSTEKRLQLERETAEQAGAEGDEEEVAHPIRKNSVKKTTQRQPKADKAQSRTSTTPPKPIAIPDPERAYIIQPGSKATHGPISPPSTSRMRASLRAEQPATNGIRKTMRPHSMTQQASHSSPRRTAQRENQTQVLSKTNRRQSAVAASQASQALTSINDVPSDKPSLQRRGSDASDSSFKRTRSAGVGGFGLRTSMRPSSIGPPRDATRGSGRFSLRSLSPAGSPFRHNSTANAGSAAPTGMMKRTLRSSSVSSHERKLPSIHLPSFGRSNKASASKHSKRASRLDDSDDEDGEVPNFNSRFDDSSDEDNARPNSSSQARPLSKGTLRASTTGTAAFRKSTPVPEVDEDSPDLPDSDDELPSPLQTPRNRSAAGGATMDRSNSGALGTATLTRSRSGRGGFNTSVMTPATSSKDRRSSLMSILKRNKRAEQAGKIQRSEIIESAARRDTKLERSSEQLRGIRGDHPASPKLQKRVSVKRSDSWPLAEASEGDGMKRPSSAGNLLSQNSTMGAIPRPTLNDRRSVSLGLPAAYDHEHDNVAVDGIAHRKKKKFGMLRRMFGLDN
ncbi:hypothetical protein F4818DRAFT_241002 [Hypoxylon cercidicola]|nr:hypothetical protein F4818DRAFT_241002 [Hypoxylon cercidicola]